MFSKLIEWFLLSGGLYGLDQLLPGITIPGPLYYFAIGGAILLVLFEIIKPILGFITFPINFITFGLFSSVLMVLIVYGIARTSGLVLYDSSGILWLFAIILGFYSVIVSEAF